MYACGRKLCKMGIQEGGRTEGKRLDRRPSFVGLLLSKQPRAKCDAQTSFHALNGGFKYVPRLKLES